MDHYGSVDSHKGEGRDMNTCWHGVRKCVWTWGFSPRQAVILYCVIFLMSFTGCGEDELEPRRSPASSLPPRVDVTVAPILSPEPASFQAQTPTQDFATPTPVALTPTVTIEESPVVKTPTPGALKNSGDAQKTPTPIARPTTTPTPKPKATPSPNPTTLKVPPPAPTATPVANTPKPTVTPQPTDTPEADAPKEPSAATPSAEQSEVEDVQAEDVQVVAPSGFTIEQIAVCTKVVNRNPVNCGDEFSLKAVTKVLTWMKVSGAKLPKSLKHVYYWEGKLMATIELEMRSSPTRTWSQKTFNPQQALGKWKVVITTGDNTPVAIKEFTVVR